MRRCIVLAEGLIVCGVREPKPKKCAFCEEPSVALCDEPKGARTCSKRICETHRQALGLENDRCPDCFHDCVEAA